MPGNPALGQYTHHYLAGGAGSLLQLTLPFLFLALLFVLMAVARWGRERAEVFWSDRKRSAVSVPVSDKNSLVAQPVLASDLEREKATSLVSHAIGEGRLSLDEGGQRIDAVLRSRHRHELDRLVADLPPAGPATAVRPFTLRPLRLGLLAVAAAALLAAVLVQALVGLWELWPLAVVAFGASALLPRR
jgi:hypothetical protein